RCDLQSAAAYLGINQYKFKRTSRAVNPDTSNPFFVRDLNKCILCAKCVRVCDEIRGVGAIDVAFRGFGSVIAAFGNQPIISSNCISCGSCVSKCPVGALYLKNEKRPDTEIVTVCTYCGVGCGLSIGVRGGQIARVLPDPNSEVNKGHLCVKGHFGVTEFVHHSERLTSPLIRVGNNFIKSTWNEALELVAMKLGKYKGPEVGVISSSKATNEENYLAQKFARVALNTNNVDQCARLCATPTLEALTAAFGCGAMTNPIGDISGAGCVLALGTNTTVSHPVLAMEIWRGVRRGSKFIVVNPKETELARWASLWLQNRPGSDAALLMGIAKVIVGEGLEDKEFIKGKCENYEAFKTSLNEYDLDFVENVSGISKEKITQAARIYGTVKPASIIYGSGITQHIYARDNVEAAANLAMLTGNVGKPSSGVNPLFGQNNVQGACDMGALPDMLPGYQNINKDEAREIFDAAWECQLEGTPGLTVTEMMKEAGEKKLKAMYIIGENPVISEPDSQHVIEALKKLEFLVVQDLFLTDTARLAHVVLPAASFAEKDGTFTNTERRVQLVRKVIEPVGDSHPDWWILCQLARRMETKGFEFANPSQIMEEIAGLIGEYAGISHSRLGSGGIQWPCPDKEHKGTPILHENGFIRGKGRFTPVEYREPREKPDAEYPLILTTERNRYHYQTGTMTRRVTGMDMLKHEEYLSISKTDAERAGIAGGEVVKVVSRRGELKVKAKISDDTPEGIVAMSFHFPGTPTNVLTDSFTEPSMRTPELKLTAVKVVKL
ncbi:MAG: formate dehydrogenase subunit alpha, partial [Dehalococcoidia bacterium]|nr:formate dehydrogenase subunit alpha [Dehalococcoidia bacterium]